jgi:hypothetical protein
MAFVRMRDPGARHVPPDWRATRAPFGASCVSGTQTRSRLKQGLPVAIWTAVLCLAALWPGAVVACGAQAPRLEPWPSGVEGLWWVRGERGDADARNRGVVSNLLIVRDGRRVWAIGSGPSPAFGRALGCVVEREVGQAISDVVSPWPRPELVLGAAGLPRARHWAHADVAQAMRRQCARCVMRLRQRIGASATDLGPANGRVRWPERLLHGASGQLGPLDWWRLQRAPGVPVTVWAVRGRGAITAHGLLWAGDAPDLRDSRVEAMRAATAQLALISRDAATLMGEQGEPARAGELEAHIVYWSALDAEVRHAQSRGDDATTVPTMLPGVEASRTKGTAHALNWQRAWRHAEDEALKPEDQRALRR